jgi:hypothetical protein
VVVFDGFITDDTEFFPSYSVFCCLGSMITNDLRRECEIKSRIAVIKAAFNKKKTLFASKLDFDLRKKPAKHSLVWR